MKNFHYKHYALVLLTLVAVFNYLDRGLLALSMESIKSEFQLSDSQLGLMSGFAFALFYAVAGVPIARWADRGNRNYVITLTTALWSVMLVLCSLVGSYTQLLLVRVGVAVGESGCIPPAQSLISDYFNRAERPHALAIHSMSSPISTMVGFIGGGWILEQWGWRTAFVLIGVVGVLLALVVKFTLREPRLVQPFPINVSQPDIKEVVTTLWKGRAFRHLVMTYCLINYLWLGTGVWVPTFFMRIHGMNAAEMGLWLGFGLGVGGLLSTYLGGYLATRYAKQRESLQMKSVAVLLLLCGFACIPWWLTEKKIVALILMVVVFAGILPMLVAPLYSAIQNLVEERMRAVALALILMLANLIGLGLGSLAIGTVSDLLVPSFGQESLRYSLLLLTPGYFWCAFHAWKTAGKIEGDIEAVEKKSGLTQAATAEVKTTPTVVGDSPGDVTTVSPVS